MKLFRRSSPAPILGLAALLFGCEHAKSPLPVDSTAARAGKADSVTFASRPANTWDVSAGPVLLVAAASPARAFVVTPDSANSAAQLAGIPRPASVTLFGRGGTVQTAELPAVVDSGGGACVVATLRAAPPPRPWSVGFIGGVVAPVALDSTQSITHGDSAALAVGMTRLASALPNDSAGRFSGLPFVVRSVWRFSIADGIQVVVATLTRQINQEATPLQEHTLLIAERPANDTTLVAAYSERSYGDEETIESRDVLAAAMLGALRTPALILVRDYGDATAYALVERGADGQWHARWSSPRRHC